MTWKPLLTGELAHEAEASVRAIAANLEPGLAEIQGPSYSGGHAGVALFHGYFAAVHGDDRSLGLVEAFIGQAIDGMAEYAYSLGFFGGISGIAWTCHHLDRLLTGEASADVTEEVDQAITEGIRVAPWTWHHDLVYGLAGIGRYALDHPDRAFAAEVIRQIAQRLGELAVERDGGLTWLTPNARIPASLGQRYPDGFYNLGLAHGTPGLIAMLGEACEAGLAGNQGRRLLEGAVTWLLANRRSDEGSAFPYYLAPTERASGQPSSRSA